MVSFHPLMVIITTILDINRIVIGPSFASPTCGCHLQPCSFRLSVAHEGHALNHFDRMSVHLGLGCYHIKSPVSRYPWEDFGLQSVFPNPCCMHIVPTLLSPPGPPEIHAQVASTPPPCRAGPKGVSTKGVSMKRSDFPNYRAFSAVVSKGFFQKLPDHGYPSCGNLCGPCRPCLSIFHCLHTVCGFLVLLFTKRRN